MRYVITGGAGFIGSNTADELVRRGHDVVVLDDLSTGKEANLDGIRSRIEFIRGSITDIDSTRTAVRGADYVIHLAARTSVPKSVRDPAETNRVNVDGTMNVLIAARDAGAKRVVFACSSSVYGETPTLPKRENMPPAPMSPYGVSKLTGELYGLVFQRVYNFEFVSLRYFNVFGPRQDPGSPYSGVLSLFSAAIQDGHPVTIYGDGEQSRDFTFIDNVVQANLLACVAKDAAGLSFNVGTGNRYTLNHTLQLLAKISGRSIDAKYTAPRAGDIRDSQADVSLAQKVLGYDAKVGFEEGLRRTWEWHCAQRITAVTANLPVGKPTAAREITNAA